MNIFVLCTGRCGSVSFVEACRHMQNYTSGHETRSGFVGADRLAYPDNHIEADNRLSWYLGRMHFKFGADAFYVHLKRDIEDVAKSYAKRKYVGIMNAFASGLLLQRNVSREAMEPYSLALEVCRTVEANIAHFLLDKPNQMQIDLESITTGFETFWNRIDAQGDLKAALGSFQNPHNTSTQFTQHRNQTGFSSKLKSTVRAAWHAFRVPNRDSSIFDRRDALEQMKRGQPPTDAHE